MPPDAALQTHRSASPRRPGEDRFLGNGRSIFLLFKHEDTPAGAWQAEKVWEKSEAESLVE